jgi:hypothetical protein
MLALASTSPAALRPEGDCLVPKAADGVEPPCNPGLADSVWPAAHRASDESGSSPFPAPRPGVPVSIRHVPLPGLVSAIFPTFSGPDRNGRRVMWANTNGPFAVVKTDLDGTLIDTWDEPENEQKPPTIPTSATATNVYNAVDADDHYLLASGTGIATFGDATPGDHGSPIRLLRRFQLPPQAQCRAPDPIVGLSVLSDGMLAIATQNGVVAVLPRRPQLQTPESVHALRLDARCDDPSVATADLEEVSNSIASDEQGGIYVVTNRAQYRVDWDGHELRRRWDVAYLRGRDAGAYTSSTRTPGSGQSPDVVSAGHGSERFVVIGDGQPKMHLLYLYADDVPAGTKPVRPGADPRIACEFPIDFGDPNATTSSSEQSFLTRGYETYISNNTVSFEDVLKLLPGVSRTLVNLFLGPAGTAARGIERVDWDPKARRCVERWAEPDASIPNAVPSLSSASGLVYGISNEDGNWGLAGFDTKTGAQRLWVPAGPQTTENSFFAMTTVGPDDTIWTGTPFGLTIYRSRTPAEPPRLVCRDNTAPRLLWPRVRLAPAETRVRFDAVVTDTACEKGSGVSEVLLTVRGRRVPGTRYKLDRHGNLRGSARATPALVAELSSVRLRATDRAGNTASARARAVRPTTGP